MRRRSRVSATSRPRVARVAAVAATSALALALGACGNQTGTGSTTAASGAKPGELGVASGGQLLEVKDSEIPKVGAKRIGIVTVCASCTGQSRFIDSLKETAKPQGWKITVSDTGGDSAKVVAAFNTFIQSKVDFIVIGALDPTTLGPQIAAAQKAGIPVAVNDGDWVPGTAFSCCQDSVGMGTQQAQWIAQRLKDGGNVVMFVAQGARNVEQRAATFEAVIAQFPKIKVTRRFQVDFADPIGSAKKQLASVVLKNKDVDAVWAGWDDPARGAAQALKEAGLDKAFVIGNDAGPDALDDIRGNSPLDGTVFVDYATEGRIFVKEMAQYLKDPKLVTGRWLYVQQPIISRRLGNVPPQGQTPPPVGYYTLWPTKAEG
jgi:ribose transport system substrate-binding protein